MEPERVYPLHGIPCERCQLPARHAEIYPRGNRIVHENRHLPPCDIVTRPTTPRRTPR